MADGEKAPSENFLRKYRDCHTRKMKTLTASQFMEIWKHYDVDGNGYIEGSELDGFLREFASSINAPDVHPESVPDPMLTHLKDCFMEAYDDNRDGKIEIRELAQLLPMEENFLLLFRFDNPLESSIDFMRTWKKYDKDNNGSIDADELKDFLRDLLKEARKISEVTEGQLDEYTQSILAVFDANNDGKLQLSEMSKLLPVRENVFCQAKFKEMLGEADVTKADIDRVFKLYDRDSSGTIDADELRGLLKDLLDTAKKTYSASDLYELHKIIMQACDMDKDGKICRRELTMILLALSRTKAAKDLVQPDQQ